MLKILNMIISIHLYTKKEQHFSSKINTDYLAILLPPLVVSTIGQIHRKRQLPRKFWKIS